MGVGGFSKVVATFNHVSGSFNLFMATTGGVWIIPSFRICGYVLYVEHISCVIMNCGQHQWAMPSLFSIALEAFLEENITRKLLSVSLDLFLKILLFQVTFLIFFSIAIFSPYFLQWQVNLRGALTFVFFLFFNIFFIGLIVAFILCAIYVREDNEFHV